MSLTNSYLNSCPRLVAIAVFIGNFICLCTCYSLMISHMYNWCGWWDSSRVPLQKPFAMNCATLTSLCFRFIDCLMLRGCSNVMPNCIKCGQLLQLIANMLCDVSFVDIVDVLCLVHATNTSQLDCGCLLPSPSKTNTLTSLCSACPPIPIWEWRRITSASSLGNIEKNNAETSRTALCRPTIFCWLHWLLPDRSLPHTNYCSFVALLFRVIVWDSNSNMTIRFWCFRCAMLFWP